jgi:hypothetical protein
VIPSISEFNLTSKLFEHFCCVFDTSWCDHKVFATCLKIYFFPLECLFARNLSVCNHLFVPLYNVRDLVIDESPGNKFDGILKIAKDAIDYPNSLYKRRYCIKYISSLESTR